MAIRRRPWHRVATALAAAALLGAGAVVGWMRSRAWAATLPPPMPPAQGRAEALRALTEGGSLIHAEELPAAAMGYPRWLIEIRRPGWYRREHVRIWVVAARLTGILPGSPPPGQPPGLPAPSTAEVWIVGIEGYCRDTGTGSLGAPLPPPPSGALCWTDLVYSGTTGRELWGMSAGAPPG